MAFSSTEFAWSNIELVALGRPVLGIKGVSYQVNQTKTNIYGRGVKPRARTRGNKEYEGSLTLLQSEVEAMQADLNPGQDLLDIPPFDITVSYIAGTVITTDILKGCEFTAIPKGMDQNDPNMDVELALIIGDIDFNV